MNACITAMYQHARTTDDTELHRLIVENDAPDNANSVEIPLILATNLAVCALSARIFSI